MSRVPGDAQTVRPDPTPPSAEECERLAGGLDVGAKLTAAGRAKVAAALRSIPALVERLAKAEDRLAFLEGDWEPSAECEHARRFSSFDASDEDGGTYDRCEKCRAETAERALAAARADV